MRHLLHKLAATSAIGVVAASAQAVQVNVGQFGDQGWKADDVRNTSGTDLVGINNTHAGKPGQTPTAADDLAIAAQIKFVNNEPIGSTYGGAVWIDGTTNNSGKSNYSVIDTTSGFGTGASLLSSFSATYGSYSIGRTLAFKLGIQSTNWGTGAGQSQNGFTAVRSGESVWDLVLVHLHEPAQYNTWITESVDHDTGNWALYDQAGNPFYTGPGGGTLKTLDDWNADATWGPRLFGAGARVTSIQFGLGSSQANGTAYLDYLQTNLLNGGDVVNFVPEPSALGPLGVGAIALLRRRRRRA